MTSVGAEKKGYSHYLLTRLSPSPILWQTGPNTGCFSRRWPLLSARKSTHKQNNIFFQDKFYLLMAQAHYFTVLIAWRAAKLGIFTHFTFKNLPQCSLSVNLLYVCFLSVLDHSRDDTSSTNAAQKKFLYYPLAKNHRMFWKFLVIFSTKIE